LSLGKKKIKIELEDAEGNKYNLSLEGNMSKEKVMKVMELMEAINTAKSEPNEYNNYHTPNQMQENLSSLSSKIWRIVENKFPFTSFTSTDILEMYTDEYNEPIKLDVVATYLSRYHKKGKLLRSKGGKEWIYKVHTQSELSQTSAQEKARSAAHGYEAMYKDLHAKNLNN
jgi:predicted transcriptional regulator